MLVPASMVRDHCGWYSGLSSSQRKELPMAARAGPRNLITDVPGILIGQAEALDVVSGTTVVLAEASAVASVDVRGGAPGSRETELLGPGTLVDRVDAVVLSGGPLYPARPGRLLPMRRCGSWRQYDDRGRRHRCRARQRRVPAAGDHGAGRSRPCDPTRPHTVRRRHRICAGNWRGPAGRARGTDEARPRRRRLPGTSCYARRTRRQAARRRPELAAAVGKCSLTSFLLPPLKDIVASVSPR